MAGLQSEPSGIKDTAVSLTVAPVRRGLKSGTRNKKSGSGYLYCYTAVYCVCIRDAMHARRPCWLARPVTSLPDRVGKKLGYVPVNDFQNKSSVRRSNVSHSEISPKCLIEELRGVKIRFLLLATTVKYIKKDSRRKQRGNAEKDPFLKEKKTQKSRCLWGCRSERLIRNAPRYN